MMLIVALVLAVIGLAALVTAVVTSNELIAWVCIGASVIGVLLLIVDALRERSRGTGGTDGGDPDIGDRGDEDRHIEDRHIEDRHIEDRHIEDRDDETTVLPAATESEPAEDYPDEPGGDTEVLTPDVAPHEQAVDPADDDLPPGVKRD